MKRLVVVFGSPHGNGNTAHALCQLMKGLPDTFEVTTFYPYKMEISPCVDCGFCRQNSGCVFHDLDTFYAQFEAADAVLFASPLYNLTFSAPLKALLDRFQPYFNARFVRGERPPIARPKRVALVMTAGSKNDGGFAFSQKALAQSLTVLNGTLCSTHFQEECDKYPKMEMDGQAAASFLHAWLG